MISNNNHPFQPPGVFNHTGDIDRSRNIGATMTDVNTDSVWLYRLS
jgi:hypothetical protein